MTRLDTVPAAEVAAHRAPDAVDTSTDVGAEKANFENTVLGRALVNLALVVTLCAILVAVMPASVTRSALVGWTQPYLTAVGLGEDWGMFAPTPRNKVIYGMARIGYADGPSSEWSFPARPGLAAYSDYRWQKFGEHVRLDARSALWPPFARYLASQHSGPGRTPVRVELSRRWATIRPPGTRPGLGPWAQNTYYSTPVGPR